MNALSLMVYLDSKRTTFDMEEWKDLNGEMEEDDLDYSLPFFDMWPPSNWRSVDIFKDPGSSNSSIVNYIL